MDITMERRHDTLDLVFTLTIPLIDITMGRGSPQEMIERLHHIDTVFRHATTPVEERLQAVRDFLTPLLEEPL